MKNEINYISWSCIGHHWLTTAGPYVTNISSDGANGLTIEKCKVEMNAFMGVVSTGDCSTSSLRLTTPNR